MHNKPIKRRKFLGTGLAGGAVIAALPIRKLLSFPVPFSDACLKPDHNLPKEHHERLLETALKYGAEFGEVSVEKESRSD
jgi:hypothetical protein